MPQLSIETFVTQYFWLVVFLLFFYYLSAAVIIPKFSTIIKTRNKISTVSSTSTMEDSNNTIMGKSILTQAFTTKSANISKVSTNYNSIFKKVNKDWIKNYKKAGVAKKKKTTK